VLSCLWLLNRTFPWHAYLWIGKNFYGSGMKVDRGVFSIYSRAILMCTPAQDNSPTLPLYLQASKNKNALP
jgi:hypothetical protein